MQELQPPSEAAAFQGVETAPPGVEAAAPGIKAAPPGIEAAPYGSAANPIMTVTSPTRCVLVPQPGGGPFHNKIGPTTYAGSIIPGVVMNPLLTATIFFLV